MLFSKENPSTFLLLDEKLARRIACKFDLNQSELLQVNAS